MHEWWFFSIYFGNFGGGEDVEQEPEDEQQDLSLWLSHLSLSRVVFAPFHFVLGLCKVNQALKLG